MKKAIIFPGQGSQSIGMLDDFASQHPQVKVVFEQASDAIQQDLWSMTQNDETRLNQTIYTQPILLAAGIAFWQILVAEKDIQADFFAGHSLGEYTALTAAGVFDFSEAIRLVHYRGQLMQAAVPAGTGAMVAVLGLDNETIQQACDEASNANESVSPANFNAPGQTVIAGHTPAVERASVRLKELKALRVLPLPVSVPSHCVLMQGAAEQLAQYLEEISIHPMQTPVVSNAYSTLMQSSEDIYKTLPEQLYKPVRWVENVQLLVAQGVTQVYECGPNNVLSSLNRRIDRTLNTLPINSCSSLDKITT